MPINNKLIIHHSNILLERPWKTINFHEKIHVKTTSKTTINNHCHQKDVVDSCP